MPETQQVTLCATKERTLEMWEQDERQTILVNPAGTLWVVGFPPEIYIGHTAWSQTCPEEMIEW